jgi:hypothetical protein
MGQSKSVLLTVNESVPYYRHANWCTFECVVDGHRKSLNVQTESGLYKFLLEMVVNKVYRVFGLKSDKNSLYKASRIENLSTNYDVRRGQCEILEKRCLSANRTMIAVAWQSGGCDTFLVRIDKQTTEFVQRLTKTHFYDIDYFVDSLSYISITKIIENDIGCTRYDGEWNDMVIL